MGVTLNERTCPNCGGQYLISLDSDFAQCANCGHTDNVDPDFSIHIRRIITEAEQNIHSNSEEGYAEAIRLLRSVPFVPESEDRIVFCETRLDELKKEKSRRVHEHEKSDKRNTRIGIYILVFILLTVILITAGLVFIIYQLKTGGLSPVATGVIIAVIVVMLVLAIIGKMHS